MFRKRRRNDEAVTEVIGYVLSFALSAVFLLIALNVFYTARGNTDDVVTGVELKTIASRIAGRIVEAGLISQEFENATLDLVVVIPQALNGRGYEITATSALVTVSTSDGTLAATATTFKLDAQTDVSVTTATGLPLQSSSERVRVHYEKVGATRQITLHGD